MLRLNREKRHTSIAPSSTETYGYADKGKSKKDNRNIVKAHNVGIQVLVIIVLLSSLLLINIKVIAFGNQKREYGVFDMSSFLQQHSERKSKSARKALKLQKLAQQHLMDEFRPRPPSPTLGAFVHVGKTGGSTLSSLLRNGFHSHLNNTIMWQKWDESIYGKATETAVSKLTTYYHVPDFRPLDGLFESFSGKRDEDRQSDHQRRSLRHEFYIFTVRDPLDRTISAFLYEHPDNKIAQLLDKSKEMGDYPKQLEKFGSEQSVREVIEDRYRTRFAERLERGSASAQMFSQFYSCFPTLEAFGAAAAKSKDQEEKDGNDDDDERIGCAETAKFALNWNKTRTIPVTHLDFSLNKITWLIGVGLIDKLTLIVRCEHQNKDWVGINEYLGQKRGSIMLPQHKLRDSSTAGRLVSDKLSEESRKNLCLGLRKEYETYFGILNEAVNISPDDVAKSLELAKRNCPWLELSLESIPLSLADVHGKAW